MNFEDKKMKAAVVEEFGKPLVIKEVDVPQPKEQEVLVKMITSGICHTDLHARDGDWPTPPPLPIIPGHEGIGEVVALGDHVTDLELGDIVGIPWLHTACLNCEYCMSGNETLCDHQENSGYSVHGSFAEYGIMDARFTVKIPDTLNPVLAAPLLCAGVTTYKALKQSNVKPGQWIGVVGIGGLGHVGVQYAKAMGMKVCAICLPDTPAVEVAKKYDVDLICDVSPEKQAEFVVENTGGLHGVIVTTASKASYQSAYNMLRKKGRLVPVGLPNDNIEVPIVDIVLTEKEIAGSIVGTRIDLLETIEMADIKKITPHTTTIKLEEVNEVFKKMEDGTIDGRYVIDFRN